MEAKVFGFLILPQVAEAPGDKDTEVENAKGVFDGTED